jgi:TetR/AcrR family transcriptional repressor of nem operon
MPAAATVLTDRGRATRDRIVAAAATLIHERGVAGTSLDDVRAVTATSKSQLYHYFTDKSALVRAVIELQVDQVLTAQQPELAGATSMAGLRRWGGRLVTLNSQDARGCPLGRLASELTDSDPAARAALTAGFARWRDELATGLQTMRIDGALSPDADPPGLALGLLAAVQGGLLLSQATGSVAPLRTALDLALDSIQARTVPHPTGRPAGVDD